MLLNKKLQEFLNEFEVYLGAICFIAITILLTWQAVSRYVLGHSFTWTEEISTILFVWLAYLGTSAAILKGKHLRIDFFLNMLKGKARKVIILITNVISMAFCGYMIPPLMRVIDTFSRSNSKTILLKIPKDLIYTMIPLCLLLTIVRIIQDSIRIVKSTDEDIKIDGNKTIFDDMNVTQTNEKEGGND